MSAIALPRSQSGFSLIEALVALLILAFGMLAVANFQLVLFANSDTAKHRTEAVRLAQDKIEQFRGFEQLATAAGKSAYDDVVSGTDTVTSETLATNATFSRTWTVAASSASEMKTLLMNVAWQDRTGQQQSVELSSIIAKLDPKATGSLLVPPAGSPVKKPMNRDLNVPVPAVDLGNGKSAFTPPGGMGYYYVFSNTSGMVAQRCVGDSADHSTNECTAITAYVISGFVRFDTGQNPSSVAPGSSRMSLDINIGLDLGSSYECSDDSQLATPTYANAVVYTCLVYPSSATTPPAWSGRTYLTPQGATTSSDSAYVTIASTNYKVCRYSFDYNSDAIINNTEHPFPYADVSDSLENQNFLVIRSNKQCPSSANDAQTPPVYRTCENSSQVCY